MQCPLEALRGATAQSAISPLKVAHAATPPPPSAVLQNIVSKKVYDLTGKWLEEYID